MKVNRRAAALAAALMVAVAPALAGGDDVTASGEAIYDTQCLACHQANGGGVPFLQPSLRGAERIIGDPEPLIAFVLVGSAGLSPDERQYDNDMPAFDHFSDADLAAVLTYVRTHFGNEASAIAPADVAAVRAR